MYYVTYSEFYPIYEAAEGGYYYPGKEIRRTASCQTFKEAKLKIRKWRKWLETHGDGINWYSFDKQAFGYRSKYIGDGWVCELTTYPVVGHGWVPYQ